MPNRFRPAPPIEDALAALDGPAYDADLTKRATKWADELRAKSGPGRRSIALDYYAKVFYDAGTVEMSRALDPPQRDGTLGPRTDAEQRKVNVATDRNVHATVVRQLKIYLRAQDVAAIWNDPDRMEAERIWNAYTRGVSSIAFTKGNKEAGFVRRWRDLLAAIYDTDADDADARVLEGRLNRLTAPVKYPVLPDAAYEAAALLPEAERLAEVKRLDAKYQSAPDVNGTGTKTPRRRLTTRPMQALSTR